MFSVLLINFSTDSEKTTYLARGVSWLQIEWPSVARTLPHRDGEPGVTVSLTVFGTKKKQSMTKRAGASVACDESLRNTIRHAVTEDWLLKGGPGDPVRPS